MYKGAIRSENNRRKYEGVHYFFLIQVTQEFSIILGIYTITQLSSVSLNLIMLMLDDINDSS